MRQKKKKTSFIVFICFMIVSVVFPAATLAEEKGANQVDLAPNAQSVVLMDADTGTLLLQKNGDKRLPPASITKVMTMLLIMEAIEQKKISYDDMIVVSEYAASMGGSQIFLEAGERMSVDHLLKGIAMASGNDASVALAEAIAGSEELFVQMMNERAKQLGMENTHFVNSSGLPADNHYSSAHDIALMSRELLKHSKITEYTKKYQDYLREDTDNPFWLVNTNKLVRFYPEVDGLKTGYTSEAKFCLAATAKKGNFRVIAIVLGEPNTKTRNAEVIKLFDYAFAQYTNHPIFKEGDLMGTYPVEKGHLQQMPLTAKHQYSVLLKKGTADANIRYDIQLNDKLKAPIKIGEPVGKLIVYENDVQIAEFTIPSSIEIKKANWWTLLKRINAKTFLLN